MPFTGSIDRGLSLNRAPAGEFDMDGTLSAGSLISRVLDGILSFSGRVTALKNGLPVGVAKGLARFGFSFSQG